MIKPKLKNVEMNMKAIILLDHSFVRVKRELHTHTQIHSYLLISVYSSDI